jgi:hypothetical protein
VERKPDRRWYTAREVANACQVTSHAVRAWLYTGVLVGFKHGHYWRVTAPEFARFIRDRSVPLPRVRMCG